MQISVTLPDDIAQLLTTIADANGLSRSALAAEIIRDGIYDEAMKIVKLQNLKTAIAALEQLNIVQ
ncbi:MAG TPA: hypothetical protein DDW51_05565 [Cyanobacteria bacterium UBA11367]|nr:hypothetical protein [Cyanobacteria bacterium UBA11367]HBE56801.1 hypothetical protein [Cyanobacteria bacterium UBA11366]HCA94638.1 hypothetical protein [Cyanobacteria bacterium UBA9226]